MEWKCTALSHLWSCMLVEGWLWYFNYAHSLRSLLKNKQGDLANKTVGEKKWILIFLNQSKRMVKKGKVGKNEE